MNNLIKVKIFAKINLSLNIVGVCHNMHLLDSVVASVDIYDAISVLLREDKNINISISDNTISKTDNSVIRAIDLIKKEAGDFGADIYVKKNIPIAGGMGGSSADAAGVILAFDRLLGLEQRGIDIKKMSSKIGSDTTYMLEGGYARMSGTGNKVEKIDSDIALNLVLVSPNKASLTADVYRKFDSIYRKSICSPSNNQVIINALSDKLKTDSISVIASNVGNALYQPAVSLCPEIQKAYKQLNNFSPKGLFMTGSGSVVAGIFDTESETKEVAKLLSALGFFATSAVTQKKGVEFYE